MSNKRWSPAQMNNGLAILRSYLSGVQSCVVDEVNELRERREKSKFQELRQKVLASRQRGFDIYNKRLMEDGERVMAWLNDNWDSFLATVRSSNDKTTSDRISTLAEDGPGHVYIYLLTIHRTIRVDPNKASGSMQTRQSIYAFLGKDNRMLWSQKQLDGVMKWVTNAIPRDCDY